MIRAFVICFSVIALYLSGCGKQSDTVPSGGDAGGTGGMNGDSFGPISTLGECQDRPFGPPGTAGAIACSWDLAEIEFSAPLSVAGDYRAVVRIDDHTVECRTTLPSQGCLMPCMETSAGLGSAPVLWRVDGCGPGNTRTKLLGLTVLDVRVRQNPTDALPGHISATLTRDDRLIGEASWDPVFECFYYGHLGCPRTRDPMPLPLLP